MLWQGPVSQRSFSKLSPTIDSASTHPEFSVSDLFICFQTIIEKAHINQTPTLRVTAVATVTKGKSTYRTFTCWIERFSHARMACDMFFWRRKKKKYSCRSNLGEGEKSWLSKRIAICLIFKWQVWVKTNWNLTERKHSWGFESYLDCGFK